jgi:hypothetical protein
MKPADLLTQASQLVSDTRAATHGDAHRNHWNIARLWNAFLSIRPEPADPLSPRDVALMMALLKVARTQLGDHNADDYVDAAGYVAIAQAIGGIADID